MVDKVTVSTTWLHQHLGGKGMVILDASQKIPDPFTIPDAVHFDLKNDFSNLGSNLPNMLPTSHQFQTKCRDLGIDQSSTIIIFDNEGVYYSPRAWWMFKVMGHEEVYILDGGLPAWKENGFLVEKRKTIKPIKGDFQAVLNTDLLRNYSQVVKNTGDDQELLIDARSEGRFLGTSPEPRPELQSGHIPNSVNIPNTELLEGHHFKPHEQLQSIFSKVGSSPKNLVFSCGSGLTACIAMAAAKKVLNHEMAVYDGSWTEWATRKGLYTQQASN